MLHICLGVSVEGRIISTQEVVDGVRLNLGLRLQPSEVEELTIKAPFDADSGVRAIEGISQHGGEH